MGSRRGSLATPIEIFIRRNVDMGTRIGVRLQLWSLGLLTVIMLVVMLALSAG
jgi:hypothetical protein